MLKYQIEELELLNLKPDEDENLSLQLDTLHNSAKIQENLYKASVLLDGDGEEYAGSISEIDKAKASLEEISELLPDVEELSNRLDSVIIELDDICSDLKGRISDIDDNAGRLIQMEDRMSDIIKIKRKYGMDVNSLIEHLEQCKEELSNIDEMDSVIEDLINRRREIGEGVKEKQCKLHR